VNSIVERARQHAAHTPDRPAYVFLDNGLAEVDRCDFATLDIRARAIAAALQDRGLAGERVLVAYPSGLAYVQAFLGCLYAGAVAVPCDSPRVESSRRRLESIVQTCKPAAILTDASDGTSDGASDFLDVAGIPDSAADGWQAFTPEPGRLAFLQYTSGSTREPRGVMVTHANIMANEALIADACRHDANSTFVGWQPLFHDMGLVANIMQPLYLGSLSVLMSPMAFLQQPLRWLQAVSSYGAHTSGGPNFAYDMCSDRVAEAAGAGLDLSSWRIAFNSAEPVRAATLRRFTDAFGPYGFSPDAQFPCYGLAEATLLVTKPARSGPPTVLEVAPDALREGRLVPSADGGTPLVSSGVPGLGGAVRIVDPQTGQVCPDGAVGEICVSGPIVTGGYWERPEETATTFGAGQLRTGDLGALAGGELYVTGRLKDMLVIHGQNHYPQDIERAAEDEYDGLRPGCTAAFPVDVNGVERLVLCCELRSYRDRPPAAELGARIARRLLRETGVELHALVVLRRGGVPKTTSGKLRRQACRSAYLAGSLPVVESATLNTATLVDAILAVVHERLDGGPLNPELPLVQLGVNSLVALELQHAIQRRYGVELGAAAVLGGASAIEIAELVLAQEPSAPAVHVDENDDGWLPLTARQRALYFEQQLDPGSAAYHLARVVPFDDVSVDALEGALQSVVRRHPALRTRFAVRDGEPMCLEMQDGPAIRRVVESSLEAESERPFDLDGFLFRPVVVAQDGGVLLLLVAHHLIADFWSLAVLLRDLDAELAGNPPDGVAPGQRRLLAAERRYTASPSFDRDRAYWQGELAGAPDRLALPFDFSPPLRRSFAGATAGLRVPADLTARLRELAADRGCTLFTVLLAAYQALLHRVTGQDDLLVGTLLAGRNDPELADAVGYLVDVVPLRSRCPAGTPFARLLGAATGTVLRAAEHGRYPFAQLVADVEPERSPSRPPLVQSLFVMHREYGRSQPGLRELALDGRLTGNWSQLDLSLSVAEIGDEIGGGWEFRTDLFEPATVEALNHAYGRLLAAIADRPATPVDRLDLVDPVKRADIRARSIGPVRGGTGSALHQLVREAAAAQPDAVAVVEPGRGHLTYGALDRAAARVAAGLRARGATPEEPVALLMERGLDLIIAYLGGLYAGCTVLPIEPADPDQRLATILHDSGARIVITQDRLRQRAVRLPAPATTVAELSVAGPGGVADVHPAQAAYLLYTSGSTGEPKGVLVPHAAIVNRIRWMQDEYRLEPGERVLHKTPLTFDVSLWELFWPLSSGGCLVLGAPGEHRDPRRILDVVTRERVSTAHFVPTMLAPFVAEAARSGERTQLRRVVCSGEVLPPAVADLTRAVLGADVHNLYGPTEAAVDVTAWPCPPHSAGPVPIGRPIANVVCRVLDEWGGEVPFRLPGELNLAGACLARGYLGRPAQTAERFVPAGAGRRYRTGDLARLREDGVLEFLGRADGQVKVGGNRVELGEIVETLRRQPDVVDAAAAVHESAIVAYVVVDDAATVPLLRDRLAELLPGAMVPSRILPLDRLPLTASGKLDRRALPVPPPEDAAGEDADTPTERRLAELWRTHLRLARVGVEHDFFALGGDSITALRVVGAARDAGLPVTVSDLLHCRTIRALAARVDATAEDPAGSDTLPAFALCPAASGRPGLDDAYPISMAQRSLLFQRSVNPGYEIYLTSVAVRGRLDRAALTAAVQAAVRRHPYLRSTFDLTTYAEPMQLVHGHLPAALEVVDLRELPPAEREPAMSRWLAAERIRPFDTAAGPIVRFTAHDGDDMFRLTVSSFGLDGWCDATLLTELLTEYAGEAPQAPRVEYRAFIALERAAIASAADHAFWQAELAGAQATSVPRWPLTASDERRHFVEVPPGLVEVAAQLGAGLKHVLLAAHLHVLSELAGRRDIVTGLQVNGRPESVDGDRVIGMFNNIVPLRSTVGGGTWADLVEQAAGHEARLGPHRRFPLVEAQRRFGAADLFDTLFVFTHFHAYRALTEATGLQVYGLHAPDQTYLPLTAHANVDAWSGQIRLLLEFDPRQFGRDQVAEIGRRYTAALTAIVAAPDAAVTAEPPGDRLDELLRRLDAISDEEAQELVRERKR